MQCWCVHTLGDKDGEQTGHAAHSQESQLRDLTRAVEGEEGEGASRHLHQAKDQLGQIDVHFKVGDVQRQSVVHQHVGKPETDGGEQKKA